MLKQQVPVAAVSSRQSDEAVPVHGRLLSSTAGSLITAVLMSPLDVAKTRMQAAPSSNTAAAHTHSHGHSHGSHAHSHAVEYSSRQIPVMREPPALTTRYHVCFPYCSTCCIVEPAPVITEPVQVVRRGLFSTISHVVRAEGPRALFAGVYPALVMAIPSVTLYFTAYDLARNKIVNAGLSPLWAPALAGPIARFLTACATSPFELVRVNMQYSGTSGGLVEHLRSDVRKYGWTAPWRGLAATLWRDVPFSVVYWTGYEYLRPILLPSHMNHVTRYDLFISAFMAGAISGAVAAIITTPFDVVKTQVQVGAPPATRTSPVQLLIRIAQTQGMQGLFTGLAPRLLRVPPSCAIMISCYELLKLFFVDN